MDARIKTSLRLLTPLLLIAVQVMPQSTPGRITPGRLFVYADLSECTQSQVNLELTGITPMPDRVILQIGREGGPPDGVISQELQLMEGKGKWQGQLLPLGQFGAKVLDVGSKQVLAEYVFANRSIARRLLSGERSELIKIRGGKENVNSESQSNTERSSYRLTDLPKRNGTRMLHIILIHSDGSIAEEYFGLPPEDQQWNSRPLPHGDYRRMVVDYDGKNPCRVIKYGSQ